jgi:tetratricopeptide (TPR) repeat protein
METAKNSEAWRERTEKLKNAISLIPLEEVVGFTRSAAGSVLRKKSFINPYNGTDTEQVFGTLYEYLETAMQDQGSLVLIPMQVGLMESNVLSVEEFVEYLHETILLLYNIEDHTRAVAPDHDEDLKNVEEAFNSLLDEVEELAEYEDYEAAIEKLDKALLLGESEPLLIYDRINMINNRAFYNCQLENYTEALADIDLAISEDPENGLLYHTKSEIFAEMGIFSKALEFIDKAILLEDTKDKHDFRRTILERI